MSATVRVIASQGLGAPPALIAKEAGVSNGSPFACYETKGDLFNQLYMKLKSEMAAAALAELPAESGPRDQMAHLWSRWLHWATSCPDKRRTLAHLDVPDEITPTSRRAASQAMAAIARLLEQSHGSGPMRGAPLALVVALTSALADAATDLMIHDPANAGEHGRSAFEALWRMIA